MAYIRMDEEVFNVVLVLGIGFGTMLGIGLTAFFVEFERQILQKKRAFRALLCERDKRIHKMFHGE